MSNKRRSSINSISRWMMIGSEIPVMVVTGAYIGYYLGKQISWLSPFSIILGAFLGFGIGVYNTFKIIQVLEKRGGHSDRITFGKQPFKREKHEEKYGKHDSSKDIIKLLILQSQEDGEKKDMTN